MGNIESTIRNLNSSYMPVNHRCLVFHKFYFTMVVGSTKQQASEKLRNWLNLTSDMQHTHR